MFDLADNGDHFVDDSLIRRVTAHPGPKCCVSFYGKKDQDVFVKETAASFHVRLEEYRQRQQWLPGQKVVGQAHN